MRVRLAVVAAVVGLTLFTASRGARAQCVDEELKQELVGGRHYRGVQERLFTKAFRHELSGMGGYYSGDLYSGSWLAGGAYTFHFSEDLGLEASLIITQFNLNIERPISQLFGGQVFVGGKNAYIVVGDVIWSPVHFKVRWSEKGIVHGDILFALGAAITVFTGAPAWRAGSRQLLLGLAAAGLTFGVGKLIGIAIAG